MYACVRSVLWFIHARMHPICSIAHARTHRVVSNRMQVESVKSMLLEGEWTPEVRFLPLKS